MDARAKILTIVLTLLSSLAAVSVVVLFDRVEHLALVILIPTMFLLGAIPIVMRMMQGKFDLFEVTIPYSLMYFLMYGAGALFVLFVDGVAHDSRSFEYLDSAVGLCTLGFACAMLGYALSGSVIRPLKEAPAPRPGWISLVVLFGIGYVGDMIQANLNYLPSRWEVIVSGLSSLLTQLSFLTMFVLFYVFYLIMRDGGPRSLKILLFGFLIPAKLLVLFTNFGSKSSVILAVSIPLIAFWYARRKVPWKSVIAFVAATVFILFPLYYQYRSVRGRHYTQMYRVERSVELLRKTEGREYAENSLKTVARRFAIINSTAIIIAECGSRVDYQYGKTLWLGVISVAIPRVVWPDKPNINIGTQFGRIFHITGFKDYSAISQSMAGELYWNFHVPGVIVGMLLLGLWMKALYVRFGLAGQRNPVRLAMYVTLLIATMGTEGDLAGMFGGLVKTAFVLLVVERVLGMQGAVQDQRIHVEAGAEPIAAR